jgi:prepilin-type N-terminal cleavage/methylation domain-containing protein
MFMKGGITPMNTQQKNKGFTIIEVVLVLAIAGLIFLMVFVALPALQAGQRDTARKNDASTVLSAINTFVSGNRGAFPTTDQLSGTAASSPAPSPHATTFRAPSQFVKDVSSNTEAIMVQIAGKTRADVKTGEIIVTQKTTCGATGIKNGSGVARQILVAGTTNQYTVTTFLEGGGGVSYCAQS